jgi:S-(hydroxymethyl)glutathione dehydrogenase / alcohol dehydrogenase
MEDINFKAAILENHSGHLNIFDEIKIPSLERGQVLVKLAYSGVCHSQIMEIDGLRGEDKFLPHMLGHEGSGQVIQIGPGVSKVSKGDKVVLGWIKGDGIDSGGCKYYCDEQIINAGSVTTFNEYAVVSENRLVEVPKDIPMDIAALFGCAVLTGSGILTKTIKPKKHSSIAFFGLGGIGMSALAASNLYDFSDLFVVDINDERLNIAKDFGATHLINPKSVDPVEYILRESDGLGVDYSVEAAGFTSTIEQAFAVIKKGTGLTVFASHPKHGDKISIDPFDLISGKKIIGSWGGGSHPDKDIPMFAELYKNGKLPLERLISKKYKLSEINYAIEDLRSGTVIRPIIEIDTSIGNEA